MTRTGFIPSSGTGFFRWIFSEHGASAAGTLFLLLLLLAQPAAAGIGDPNSVPDSPGFPSRQIPAGGTPFVTLPGIALNATPGFFVRQYTFSFQQDQITVGTNVSAAVYYGAKNGEKFATTSSDEPAESLAPDYYRSFVNDPAQEELYNNLLDQFRAIRQEHQYTDDEYAELLTVFVQSLPYDNQSEAHPDTLSRFPAETLIDGTGDCDDKSVLLAGLLSQEGYNVSLLLFIPEHHMAVGLVSDCLQFNETGYLYVETTGLSFMGDVPERLNPSEKYGTYGEMPDIMPITSVPLVVRVGSGQKKINMAAVETGYILAQKARIDGRIASLHEQISTTSPENLSRFRMLVGSYNAYAGVHNYIVKHRHDRAGTYRYLISFMPPVYPGQSFCVTPVVIPRCPEMPPDTPDSSCRITHPFAEEPAAGAYPPASGKTRVSWQPPGQNLRQALAFLSC